MSLKDVLNKEDSIGKMSNAEFFEQLSEFLTALGRALLENEDSEAVEMGNLSLALGEECRKRASYEHLRQTYILRKVIFYVRVQIQTSIWRPCLPRVQIG